MRHIERNLCTLKYTYSYTLIYTLHIEYTENNILLHKLSLALPAIKGIMLVI